jgi:hypothetical protein
LYFTSFGVFLPDEFDSVIKVGDLRSRFYKDEWIYGESLKDLAEIEFKFCFYKGVYSLKRYSFSDFYLFGEVYWKDERFLMTKLDFGARSFGISYVDELFNYGISLICNELLGMITDSNCSKCLNHYSHQSLYPMMVFQ